ncbi:hypothetical protein BKA82DRAFT_4216656 [Pisolithus tinctorius]|nr:hypothetical protein BKA82DRAFT_4216656 [Pisolithus tinctorius]
MERARARKLILVLTVHSTWHPSHLSLGQAADEAVHTGTAGSRAPRQHDTHCTNGCCPLLTTQINHAKLFVCWFCARVATMTVGAPSDEEV